jgi:hypothetical protein
MKQFFLLFALVPVCSFAQQQWQIGTYITCDIPNHTIMPKMSTNPGMGLQFAYKPLPRIPVMFELKGSLGTYSDKTLQQTYIFDSTSSTTTNVRYSSAMNRISLGAKIHLVNEYHAIRPFITPQIGMAYMRSRIVIAEPGNQDDCKALERKTTQRYSGFTYGAEAGVEISFEKLFKNVSTENKHRLYASVTFMNSFNKFEYVNVKYMQDHDHMAMSGSGSSGGTNTDDGRDINASFVNVSTNSIHEHKIAELYRTNLQFWGFNIGYVFNF